MDNDDYKYDDDNGDNNDNDINDDNDDDNNDDNDYDDYYNNDDDDEMMMMMRMMITVTRVLRASMGTPGWAGPMTVNPASVPWTCRATTSAPRVRSPPSTMTSTPWPRRSTRVTPALTVTR